jgi:ribonuclease HI
MEDNSGAKTRIFFDGSSFARGRRGGPGASAGAAVVISPSGMLVSRSRFIRLGDSDVAEYEGLILGITLALEAGARAVEIFGDSRNVIDQVLGKKSVKKTSLSLRLAEVKARLQDFPEWSLQWIPREKNGLADAEARRCIESLGLYSGVG